MRLGLREFSHFKQMDLSSFETSTYREEEKKFKKN